MNRISDKDLRGLPVYTKGGEKVGKVSGFTLDADRHEIEQYAVSKSRLLSALLPGDLLIHRTQVLELTAERMVVSDAAVNERVAEAVLPVQATATEGGSIHAAQMER